MAVQEPKIDGPIPGQSLTGEPGGKQWETPPELVTVEETAEFYFEKLLDPAKSSALLAQIEDGMPLTLMADSLQALGVFKGLHTVHMGVLISPVLVELMKAIAEDSDVSYVIGTEEDALVGEQDKSMAFRALKKVYPSATREQIEGAVAEAEEKAMDDMNMPNEAQMEGQMSKDTEEEQEPPRTGLMAKKQSEMM